MYMNSLVRVYAININIFRKVQLFVFIIIYFLVTQHKNKLFLLLKIDKYSRLSLIFFCFSRLFENAPGYLILNI